MGLRPGSHRVTDSDACARFKLLALGVASRDGATIKLRAGWSTRPTRTQARLDRGFAVCSTCAARQTIRVEKGAAVTLSDSESMIPTTRSKLTPEACPCPGPRAGVPPRALTVFEDSNGGAAMAPRRDGIRCFQTLKFRLGGHSESRSAPCPAATRMLARILSASGVGVRTRVLRVPTLNSHRPAINRISKQPAPVQGETAAQPLRVRHNR